jgi:hypothetical protein
MAPRAAGNVDNTLELMIKACQPEVKRFVAAMTDKLTKRNVPPDLARAIVFAALGDVVDSEFSRHIEGNPRFRDFVNRAGSDGKPS